MKYYYLYLIFEHDYFIFFNIILINYFIKGLEDATKESK